MVRPLVVMPILMVVAVAALASHTPSAEAEVRRQRINSIGHSVSLDCNPETAQVGQQRPIKLNSRGGQTAPAGTVVSISYYETLDAQLPLMAETPVRQRIVAVPPTGPSGPHKKIVTWTLKHSLTGRQVETTTIMAAQCIAAAYVAPVT